MTLYPLRKRFALVATVLIVLMVSSTEIGLIRSSFAQSEMVPVSLTITRFRWRNSPDDFLEFGPEFYSRVRINGIESRSSTVGPCDNIPPFTGCIFEPFIEPFWQFSSNVDSSLGTIPIEIRIFDPDTFSSDDQMDISLTDSKHATIMLDLTTGNWTVDGVANTIFSEGTGFDEAGEIVFDLSIASSTGDADGDGLLDGWETRGYDEEGDGIIDVDLPSFGADPNHKDIFLELDWMPGNAPSRAAIQAMKTAFANAPISAGTTASSLCPRNGRCGVDAQNNPDGTPGINLWVDTGQLVDPTAQEDGSFALNSCSDGIDNGGDGIMDANDPDCLVGDNLGGGNMIPLSRIPNLDSSFYAAKRANYDTVRKFIFRYGISAVPGLEDGSNMANSCFDGIDNGMDGNTDNLDPDCQVGGGWGERGGDDFIEYNHDGGTIMHELGHTLNLGHGGDSRANCKPNYVSVMNYDHQFNIRQFGGGGILDFSPPRFAGGRGNAPLPMLTENNLTELTLDNSDPANQLAFSQFSPTGTEDGVSLNTCNDNIDNDGNGRTDAADPACYIKVRSQLNLAADWNGDGPTAGSYTANIDLSANQNINAVAMPGAMPIPPNFAPTMCTPANLASNSTLTGFDDWSNISISFRHFGISFGGAINPITEREPTLKELMDLEEQFNTADLEIRVQAQPDIVAAGDLFTYKIEVINNGPNPVREVEIINTLPSEVTLFDHDPACEAESDSTIKCDLRGLAANTSQTLEIHVLANAIREDAPNNEVSITNMVRVVNKAGNDLNEDNNEASVTSKIVSNRVGSGLQAFYSFQEAAGSEVHDLSGVDNDIHLMIDERSTTNWIDGGLDVTAPSTISSSGPANKIIHSSRDTNEVTLEAWIAPQNTTQRGPARILTLSEDAFSSNFTLGQGRYGNQPAELFTTRLRTTHTSEDGRPSTITPNGVSTTDLTHVVFTRDENSVARLYVNGVEEATRTVGGDFSNWETSYPLVFASEEDGSNPWVGEYHLVAIFNRALSISEIEQNYKAGPGGADELIGPPITDDLFGYDFELWTDPAAPRAQITTKIGAVVHRQSGKSVFQNVRIHLYNGDPTDGGTFIGESVIERLSPRSSAITSATDWVAPDSGVYTLFAVIDPDNEYPEINEDNNTLRRNVTVLPFNVSPSEDLLAPRVDSFLINDGAEVASVRSATLTVEASDPLPSSGMKDVLFVEYDYHNNVGEWVPVQIGEWQTYETTPSIYPWMMQPNPGAKYFQAWARDVAENVSLFPYQAYINYSPDIQTVEQDEGQFYRHEFEEGDVVRVRLESISGDPDLYIWAPDYNEGRPPWVSNLRNGDDIINFRAPIDGVYQIEVYGYTLAEYRLIVEVNAERSALEVEPEIENFGIDPSKPKYDLPIIPLRSIPDPLWPLPAAPQQSRTIYLPIVLR